jgi:hypothetical protein
MKEQALAAKGDGQANGEAVMEALNKSDAGRTFELFLEAMIKLQTDVNAFMDSNRNTAPMRQGKLPPPGIKQVLEKKEGLFRKHMMVSPSPGSCLWWTLMNRVNESIMPLDQSFHPISISKPMKSEFHPFLLENSPTPNQ